MYDIQHCFICRPSDSTVSEDAGFEPRTVASPTLAVKTFFPMRFNGNLEKTFRRGVLEEQVQYCVTLKMYPPYEEKKLGRDEEAGQLLVN
jgi:hypothetical protein